MGLFSKDENDFGCRKNKGVLYGTVVTYECDPEEDCRKCEGSGRCPTCGGEGSSLCEDCGGDGECKSCQGRGGTRCEGSLGGNLIRISGKGRGNENNPLAALHCKGSGVCELCGGNGWVKTAGGIETCKACKGSGKCRYCHGTGTIECDSCHGSGQCHHCKGNGRNQCDECNGDGECHTCDGHGRVECPRCKGTGSYQKFTTYTIKGVRMDGCFTGNTEYAKCIREATGEVIFDGVQKKWENEDQIELDRTDEVKQLGMACDSELYTEYLHQYQDFLENKAPKSEDVRPYRKTVKIEKVRVAKIEYVVDGKSYTMCILGDNDTVACESVPKTIEALKLSLFEKTKLLAMTLYRKKEYAQLAHYIFKIDGVAEAEQRMLNVAVKRCCKSPEDEAKFREELKKFDPATLSFEDLRKQLKALFSSKKLIAFVWQCIAVDKKVSPKEEELFKKIVAEYKNVTPEQVEKIKGLAARIAKLSDEEILDEYLTVRN